jgi:hypothetical protein
VEISFFDLAGKEVVHSSYPPFIGRNYLKLEGEFSRLPGGAYILKVSVGTLNGRAKLIKF